MRTVLDQRDQKNVISNRCNAVKTDKIGTMSKEYLPGKPRILSSEFQKSFLNKM